MNEHLTTYALQNPQKFDKYHKLVNTEAKYLSAIKSSIKDVQTKDDFRITSRNQIPQRPSIQLLEQDDDL